MVKHDKKSFLAGIAVGRAMKGWSTATSGGSSGNVASHTFPLAAKVTIPNIIPATFDRNLSVLAPLVLIPAIIPVTYVGPEEVI